VPVPSKTIGYELLRELDRGTNAFTGSTKGKRSIANRPQGAYGRLRATRPGEYVILDTNRLDVFAMEPVTCWVQCEFSVAMDLYSRVITGLRLTPVSTKAVDIAGVLFETVHAPSHVDRQGGAALPYCGVPSAVVVDPGKLADARGRPLLPGVAAETIVFDHGKVYLSNHIRSVCERFGISLQPVRLDYWIGPGRTGGLGSSLSDHFGRLPARPLPAGLPDRADPAPDVQGCRAFGTSARERRAAPPDQPGPLRAGRPAVAGGTVAIGPPPLVG